MEKFGGLHLNNLDAEEVLAVLEFNKEIGFTDEEQNLMIELAEKYPLYHNFLTNISNYQHLNNKFDIIMKQLRKQKPLSDEPTLEQQCRWYYDLIFLELNQIYQFWYNELPTRYVNTLSKELVGYLFRNYEDYYNRIKKWEIKGKPRM
jgi:hypothetical protein